MTENNKGVPRRVALKVLGTIPVAVSAPGLAGAAAPAAQTQRPAAPSPHHIPPGPPVAARKGKYAPRFFTEKEWQTASVLADMIIPADDRSGSATQGGAVEYIDEYADFWGDEVQHRLRGGLAWLDRECRSRFGKDFVDCGEAERRQVLDLIAYPPKDETTEAPDKRQAPAQSAAAITHPAQETPSKPIGPAELRLRRATRYSTGIGFFNLFRDLTASGFYTSEIGIADLGFMGNRAFDWKGCPPEVLAKLGLK